MRLHLTGSAALAVINNPGPSGRSGYFYEIESHPSRIGPNHLAYVDTMEADFAGDTHAKWVFGQLANPSRLFSQPGQTHRNISLTSTYVNTHFGRLLQSLSAKRCEPHHCLT
jgi:hypothetical protein